jgi:hypothetical protein
MTDACNIKGIRRFWDNQVLLYKYLLYDPQNIKMITCIWVRVMMFNATFNNISPKSITL